MCPLILLGEILESDEALSVEATDWLRTGLHQYMAGEDLEAALGLKRFGSEGVSVSRLYRYEKRNQHIRAALSSLSIKPNISRDAELAKQVRRFARSLWPRLQFESDPPETLSKLDNHLFQAFRVGLGVPETKRGIAKIGNSPRSTLFPQVAVSFHENEKRTAK